MTQLLKLQNINKSYSDKRALHNVELSIEAGQIVGLIGANGAGKSTLLKALLGLIPCDGDIQVLGQKVGISRHKMLEQVAYVADVAVLPDWLKVNQVIEYMQGVHPAFNRDKAENFLAKTNIKPKSKIKALSKGMKTQLHLSLTLALDVKVLILDEPTLGLDLVTRKNFYSNLLEEFYREDRAIIITTHQIEEIEHVISHVAFIKQGQLVVNQTVDELKHSYQLLEVGDDAVEQAKALGPVTTHRLLGKTQCLFKDNSLQTLSELGQTATPNLSDIFSYLMQQEVRA